MIDIPFKHNWYLNIDWDRKKPSPMHLLDFQFFPAEIRNMTWTVHWQINMIEQYHVGVVENVYIKHRIYCNVPENYANAYSFSKIISRVTCRLKTLTWELNFKITNRHASLLGLGEFFLFELFSLLLFYSIFCFFYSVFFASNEIWSLIPAEIS